MVSQHLDLDQRTGEHGLRAFIGEQRRSIALEVGRVRDEPVEPRAQRHLPRQRCGAALVRHHVHGDLPALPRPAEHVLLRDEDVVEEQLAEFGVPRDLLHRPHLDAWGLDVDDQQRDALVLWRVCIRPCEHAAPAGELPPRDPRLLSVDHVAVVRLDRDGAQRGEIRSCLGLGEALAPQLLRREDRRDVTAALLVGPERENRRSEHVQSDDRDPFRRAGCRHLLVDDDLLDRGAAAAAELRRPRAPDVAGLVAARLPAAKIGDPVVEVVRELRRIGTVLGEELAHLVAQRALLRFECEPHQRISAATTESASTMPRQRARIVSL